MDSSTSAFPLFPLLPKELRTSIWEHAITPRVIPFERQLYYFSPQHAPSFIYLLGGDYPFTHFTFETLERPNSPYYTAHLEPVNVQYPTILEVCHESREAAIAQGYKPWHITNHRRKVKNLMWNPKIDVVFLKDSNISGARHPLSAPRPGLDLFFEQFPEQVREVQKILFWSSYWPRFLQFSTDILIPLMRFETLKEFIVIIDDTWERDCLDDGRLWRSCMHILGFYLSRSWFHPEP